MAAPTAPTLTSLTTEALKKAGYSSPSAAMLTRAQDEWMEEVKNDILVIAGGKRLKSLHTTSCTPTVNGQSRYSMPTDYFSDLSIQLMDGSITGTAQTGAAGSITFAADDAQGDTDPIGKEIFIYSGTGSGSLSQCVSYSSSTKVCGVSPNFNTAPDGTSKYMVVDMYYALDSKPLHSLMGIDRSASREKPSFYCPIGDADYGEFVFNVAPYRSSTIPYGIKFAYYANLMTLDLAGTLISTLYQRWRNVWIQGCKAKQLESDDDALASNELAKYSMTLQTLIARETYGVDLSNLQCIVSDY